ncbi:hypothetical protein QUB63_26390 [Microcoleus sp. ARI1-B5]|uniref:hypothetical protein n=1 Tax=unclassified Microcoleus TaxID=2642155 RepID=UPI002FD2F6A6
MGEASRHPARAPIAPNSYLPPTSQIIIPKCVAPETPYISQTRSAGTEFPLLRPLPNQYLLQKLLILSAIARTRPTRPN